MEMNFSVSIHAYTSMSMNNANGALIDAGILDGEEVQHTYVAWLYVCMCVCDGMASLFYLGIRSGGESAEVVFFFESCFGPKPLSHCHGLEYRQLGRSCYFSRPFYYYPLFLQLQLLGSPRCGLWQNRGIFRCV